MPELPEVETVRRSLEPLIVGRRIAGIRGGTFPDIMGPDGLQRSDRLIGRQIVGLDRRGKYLIADLDDRSVLLVHLRMTGQLVIADPAEPPLRFQHLALALARSSDQSSHGQRPTIELRFADQRKFGRVLHIDAPSVPGLFRHLGPEPLAPDFTAVTLSDAVHGRRAPIKNVLLDQRRIAGLGNIYVDEALFRAGIHPLRPAGLLTSSDLAKLHEAIQTVLIEALDRRGTTFSSFLDGYGRRGENGSNLRVYGRGRMKAPCPTCGTPLESLRLGGRSSSYCPICQPIRPLMIGQAGKRDEPVQ